MLQVTTSSSLIHALTFSRLMLAMSLLHLIVPFRGQLHVLVYMIEEEDMNGKGSFTTSIWSLCRLAPWGQTIKPEACCVICVQLPRGFMATNENKERVYYFQGLTAWYSYIFEVEFNTWAFSWWFRLNTLILKYLYNLKMYCQDPFYKFFFFLDAVNLWVHVYFYCKDDITL